MTIQHIDVDSDEFNEAPKGLRDYAKQLRKQLESVTSERDQFRNQVQSQAVGSVLADKGFKNPKRVERDLLADGIDPLDKSAVESWLSENGDDYAKGDAGQSAPPAQQQEQHQAAQAAQQQINTVSADAEAADTTDAFKKAQAEIEQLGRQADGAAVAAIYRKYGV